ncbi:MAG: hypothetical protein WKG07_16125 [Hymenobacter sp.]
MFVPLPARGASGGQPETGRGSSRGHAASAAARAALSAEDSGGRGQPSGRSQRPRSRREMHGPAGRRKKPQAARLARPSASASSRSKRLAQRPGPRRVSRTPGIGHGQR